MNACAPDPNGRLTLGFLRGSTHFFCGHRSSEIQMSKIWRKLPKCNRLHAPAVTNVWHEHCLHLNSEEKHFYKQMTSLHLQTSKKRLTRAVFTSFPVSSSARSTDSVSWVKRWVSDVIFRFASPCFNGMFIGFMEETTWVCLCPHRQQGRQLQTLHNHNYVPWSTLFSISDTVRDNRAKS